MISMTAFRGSSSPPTLTPTHTHTPTHILETLHIYIYITWVSMTSDSQRAYQLSKTAYFIIEFHVGNSNNKFSLGMLGKK